MKKVRQIWAWGSREGRPGAPAPHHRALGHPHLVPRRLHRGPVLREHHGQGEEEHEQPVAHVAEHHGEEEGEGDDGVGRCGQRGRAVRGTCTSRHLLPQEPEPRLRDPGRRGGAVGEAGAPDCVSASPSLPLPGWVTGD